MVEYMPINTAKAVLLVEVPGPKGWVRMAMNLTQVEIDLSQDLKPLHSDDAFLYGVYAQPMRAQIEAIVLEYTYWDGEWPADSQQQAIGAPHAMIDASHDARNDSPAPQS